MAWEKKVYHSEVTGSNGSTTIILTHATWY